MSQPQINLSIENMQKLKLLTYEVQKNITIDMPVYRWNVWKDEIKKVFLPKGTKFSPHNFLVKSGDIEVKENKKGVWHPDKGGSSLYLAKVEPILNINEIKPTKRVDEYKKCFDYIDLYNNQKEVYNKLLEVGSEMVYIREEGWENFDTTKDAVEFCIEELKNIDLEYDWYKDDVLRLKECLSEVDPTGTEDHRYFRGFDIYDLAIFHQRNILKL